jgi:hypothetical protein
MSSPLDLSGIQTPRQIQENLMAYIRLFAGLPGITLSDAESFWYFAASIYPPRFLYI